MKKFLLLGLTLFAAISSGYAQTITERSCGSMGLLEQQLAQDPDLERRMNDIERHTEEFVASGGGTERVVITIPVVFHIIHNGDAVGSGENISDAAVMAQLDQLNKDYRKLNSDASLIPAAFAGVAADAEIQFCLAQRKPDGTATTGINRLNMSYASWQDGNATSTVGSIESNLKPNTIWDRNKYLNIWSVVFGGSSAGLLGYAQFPGGTASTDGVICLYSSFGSTSVPNSAGGVYGKGRTLTHEVGHWLNLRHIWGDANCGSDLVSDTPTQQTSNYGCPTYPHVTCSNGTAGDMFMNYMDYVDDACMYMFSAGQKTRMQALFASGGSRASLATSDGCTAPSGGGTTCGSPASLAAGSITTSGATLSWAAVSGASSYNVQYKVSSASTWTTTTSTTNSKSLTGLTAATAYAWQVQAVCSGGTSAYVAGSNFTTLSTTTTCGNPSSLAAGSITTSGATLSWAAVSGASSYNVQYKVSSASTWTTTTSTTTSKALTGLTAATTYAWQVQAVCTSGSGSYVAGTNFTTTSSGTTGCTDNYESNNSSSTAKTIAVNTDLTALISTSTDKDYFTFTTTSAAPKVKINLSNLPADYDVKLYRGSTLVGTSAGTGTTEQIIYNSATAGYTYTIYVYGYNGAYNASSCYTFRASTSSTNFARTSAEFAEGAEQPMAELIVAPNPVNNTALIMLPAIEEEQLNSIAVLDLAGRVVMNEQRFMSKGENQVELDLSSLPNGMYIVRVENNQAILSRKIIVSH
jgi:hypothetical protein